MSTGKWAKAAQVATGIVGAVKIPQYPQVMETGGAVFVEAFVEIDRCRECGDALLPCEACKKVGCSNGLCVCSKHTCLDMEE